MQPCTAFPASLMLECRVAVRVHPVSIVLGAHELEKRLVAVARVGDRLGVGLRERFRILEPHFIDELVGVLWIEMDALQEAQFRAVCGHGATGCLLRGPKMYSSRGPFFALGSLVTPSVQAQVTRKVAENEQGACGVVGRNDEA